MSTAHIFIIPKDDNITLSKSKPSILVDEQILGMTDFLRDLGWNVVKVTDVLGLRAPDDHVIDFARRENYIIVTQDRNLAKRCRVIGVKVVEVGLEDLVRKVDHDLKQLEKAT